MISVILISLFIYLVLISMVDKQKQKTWNMLKTVEINRDKTQKSLRILANHPTTKRKLRADKEGNINNQEWVICH